MLMHSGAHPILYGVCAMKTLPLAAITLGSALLVAVGTLVYAQKANLTRGQRVFGSCAACHSLQPDRGGFRASPMRARTITTVPSRITWKIFIYYIVQAML